MRDWTQSDSLQSHSWSCSIIHSFFNTIPYNNNTNNDLPSSISIPIPLGEEQETHHIAAMEVIVDNIKDMDRAKEFAERVNIKPCWSKLGKAQLDTNVSESIAAYIKAGDADDYNLVIAEAEKANNHEDLVTYLKMCRKSIKETVLDTQLIYSLSRTNKLAELEEVISVANVAKIDTTGERCFDEELYEAAKILFTNINNNAKLALCFVKMGQFREAVDAATKVSTDVS